MSFNTENTEKINSCIFVTLSNEICLLKNPRDTLSAFSLFKAAFPSRFAWCKEVFHDVMNRKKFAYMYLSFNVETDPKLVVRTDIFYNQGETPL